MANGFGDPGEEVSRIFFAFPLTGLAEGLAGVSSAENIGSWDVIPVHFLDVSDVGYIGPVFLKYATGVRVDFAVPDHAHSCAFKAEVKSSDAAE